MSLWYRQSGYSVWIELCRGSYRECDMDRGRRIMQNYKGEFLILNIPHQPKGECFNGARQLPLAGH